jgi:hypothetical protein
VGTTYYTETILTERKQTDPRPERKIFQKKLKNQKFMAWKSIQHKTNANKRKREKCLPTFFISEPILSSTPKLMLPSHLCAKLPGGLVLAALEQAPLRCSKHLPGHTVNKNCSHICSC